MHHEDLDTDAGDAIRLPAPPPVPPRPAIPLLTAVAPVIGAVVLWRLTGSVYSLWFAALGPVLAIATFADEDEAVRLANDTEYGLVSYVFTRDLARGHRMIDRLETGMMGLNAGVVSNAAAPFGGVKQSGMGREGGLEGIHEYLDTKYIALTK